MVCPPEIRAGQRADRVLDEFGLMLGSLPPAARKALAAALVLLDQGARLYPPARGRHGEPMVAALAHQTRQYQTLRDSLHHENSVPYQSFYTIAQCDA